MPTRLVHQTSRDLQNKGSGKQRQLEETLTKTEAVLMKFIKDNVPRYKNFSKLAKDVASIVGVDPSLYRKRNTPQKKLFDVYAVKLCEKAPPSIVEPPLLEETLLEKLREARRRIAILEKVLKDLKSENISNSLDPKMHTIEAKSFLHAFDLTCQLVEKILKEDQFLYFERGGLMTRATMTAIPAALAESKICKPFLEWRHAKDTHIGSVSTNELEKSLRCSAERGGNNID